MIRRLAAALVLACALAPAAARADDVDRVTARALAEEGRAALAKRDWQRAVDFLARAEALLASSPGALLEVEIQLAQARVGLGRWVSAQETYHRVIDAGSPSLPPPARRAVDQARRELAALAPRIPTLVIVMKGPEDAVVTLDGERVPPAALGVKRPVDPGIHVVRVASARTRADLTITTTLAEGKHEAVTIALDPGAIAADPAPAAALGAPPPAPLAPLVMPPAFPPPVSFAPPIAPAPLPPPLPPRDEGAAQRISGIVAFGLGGAGLVMGTVSAVVASAKHADLEELCAASVCPASALEKLDAYRTAGTIATVGFVSAGVGAGLGALLFFTAPKAPQQIAPAFGLGYAGVRGAF